jgi:hypothetical protein
MAIVYRHRRLDTNEIFYVGIGKYESRAYQKTKTKRSQFWFNITEKTEYEVEIIARDITYDDACELEVLLISEYGRKDLGTGSLVNLTVGGEKPPLNFGDKNFSRTKEGREIISKRMTGRIVTEETRLKLSINRIENNIIPPSQKGSKRSEETRLKHSNSIKGSKSVYAKKVICNVTNKIWGCVKDCANENNLVYSTLIAKLNGRKNNNTTYQYV